MRSRVWMVLTMLAALPSLFPGEARAQGSLVLYCSVLIDLFKCRRTGRLRHISTPRGWQT